MQEISFDHLVYNGDSRQMSIGGAIYNGVGAGLVLLTFAEPTDHLTVDIVEAHTMICGLRLTLALGL
jgi:hypothetical protein